MSVHSEVQNLYRNKSGNAPLFISSRSGDKEEGAEYFDMRASTEPNALEVLEDKDGRADRQAARKEFLYNFFTLLQGRLNRFEWEYIKQLYTAGQPEEVVLNNLGLKPKKFKQALQKHLAASAEDVAALVAASEWEDAELFSRCFLSAPQGIKTENEARFLPKTVKGFGNLVEQLARHRYRKIYNKHRQRYISGELLPARLLHSKKIQQRLQAVVTLFNMLGPVYLEKQTEEFRELVYRSVFSVVHAELAKLLRIIVYREPLEVIEQEERAEREERAEARRAEEESERGEFEDEEGAPVGAAV